MAIHRQVWGLENPAFLAAQIEAESYWIDGRISSAAARGLCQFIEPTAAGVERLDPGLVELGRYSPAWCFRAQATLMKDEFGRFKPGRGSCTALLLAASSYNGGPKLLQREIDLCARDPGCDPSRWFGHISSQSARARWAWNENRPYVERIWAREPNYAAEGWGTSECR